MTNFSFALANSMATFGAATGSFEVAITVGPFNREPMATTSVPSRAILARRFFETFTDAPACFICMRSFCIWATVRPE